MLMNEDGLEGVVWGSIGGGKQGVPPGSLQSNGKGDRVRNVHNS